MNCNEVTEISLENSNRISGNTGIASVVFCIPKNLEE
jgi:hypothetical protein